MVDVSITLERMTLVSWTLRSINLSEPSSESALPPLTMRNSGSLTKGSRCPTRSLENGDSLRKSNEDLTESDADGDLYLEVKPRSRGRGIRPRRLEDVNGRNRAGPHPALVDELSDLHDKGECFAILT